MIFPSFPSFQPPFSSGISQPRLMTPKDKSWIKSSLGQSISTTQFFSTCSPVDSPKNFVFDPSNWHVPKVHSVFYRVKSLKTLKNLWNSPKIPWKNASNAMKIAIFSTFSHAFPAAWAAASAAMGSATVVATSVKAPSSLSRSSCLDDWMSSWCFNGDFVVFLLRF